MQEQVLHEFWQSHAIEHSPFASEEGQEITVISPGKPASADGPDFREAILNISGEIQVGSVEIHLREKDWFHHQHEQNPQFQQVLLHLFLYSSNTPAISSEHSVVLHNQLSPESIRPSSRPLCRMGARISQNPEMVKDVFQKLETMGKDRILKSSRTFRETTGELSQTSRIAREILFSLGYQQNKQAMKQLGKQISWKHLRTILRNTRPSNRQLTGEAILLSTAGLLEKTPGKKDRSDARWRAYREQCRDIENNHHPQNSRDKHIDWETKNIRPLNSPWRRIAGFVALYTRFFMPDSPSLETSYHFLTQTERQDRAPFPEMKQTEIRKAIIDPLKVESHEVDSFWVARTAPARPLNNPAGLIGKHRASVIWLNTVLPYLFSEDRTGLQSRRNHHLQWICRNVSFPLGDHRTNRVQTLLFGASKEKIPLTPYIEQGMHALYKSFCRFGSPGCKRCPLKS